MQYLICIWRISRCEITLEFKVYISYRIVSGKMRKKWRQFEIGFRQKKTYQSTVDFVEKANKKQRKKCWAGKIDLVSTERFHFLVRDFDVYMIRNICSNVFKFQHLDMKSFWCLLLHKK